MTIHAPRHYFDGLKRMSYPTTAEQLDVKSTQLARRFAEDAVRRYVEETESATRLKGFFESAGLEPSGRVRTVKILMVSPKGYVVLGEEKYNKRWNYIGGKTTEVLKELTGNDENGRSTGDTLALTPAQTLVFVVFYTLHIEFLQEVGLVLTDFDLFASNVLGVMYDVPASQGNKPSGERVGSLFFVLGVSDEMYRKLTSRDWFDGKPSTGLTPQHYEIDRLSGFDGRCNDRRKFSEFVVKTSDVIQRARKCAADAHADANGRAKDVVSDRAKDVVSDDAKDVVSDDAKDVVSDHATTGDWQVVPKRNARRSSTKCPTSTRRLAPPRSMRRPPNR